MGDIWLFGLIFSAQTGHLAEHIIKALTGSGLLGPAADSELSHLLFNGLIAVVSVLLIIAYPKNPWVYPLAAICLLHGFEHIYIYQQYLMTGSAGGPGLLGDGGVIGFIPLARLDLHNVYNGAEAVLMALGFWYGSEELIVRRKDYACA
ncbi:MAG: hypothetical protein HY071_01755 [Chloroflexi bacterium]|nr:hypothetical protein [Chloroflexota bacterium]